MIARFGDDATDVDEGPDRRCSKHALATDEVEPFLAELERSIERKCAATEWLLARGGWDLFLTVFKESHCVGHLCWSAFGETQEPLRRIYRALDTAIGHLVERVAAATPVIVFSSLGMEANHSGEHLLDTVLEKLERHIAPRRTVLRRMRERLRREQNGALTERGRARAARVAYTVDHNEGSGAVRVNVAGREPRGMVRRGRELDELCDRLTNELLALTDPEDGHPIVERVLRSDRVYVGAHLDELPDLLVVWRRNAPIRGAASAAIGEVRVPAPNRRPGNHVEGGILFARGPAIGRDVQLPRADIVDLAPTLAAQVGVRLEDVDGRAIEGVSGRGGAAVDPRRP